MRVGWRQQWWRSSRWSTESTAGCSSATSAAWPSEAGGRERPTGDVASHPLVRLWGSVPGPVCVATTKTFKCKIFRCKNVSVTRFLGLFSVACVPAKVFHVFNFRFMSRFYGVCVDSVQREPRFDLRSSCTQRSNLGYWFHGCCWYTLKFCILKINVSVPKIESVRWGKLDSNDVRSKQDHVCICFDFFSPVGSYSAVNEQNLILLS